MPLLLPVLFVLLTGCATFDAAARQPAADARAFVAKAKPVLALCPLIPHADAPTACADLAEAVKRAEAMADALVPVQE